MLHKQEMVKILHLFINLYKEQNRIGNEHGHQE